MLIIGGPGRVLSAALPPQYQDRARGRQARLQPLRGDPPPGFRPRRWPSPPPAGAAPEGRDPWEPPNDAFHAETRRKRTAGRGEPRRAGGRSSPLRAVL